ncbi:MAG: hypothetical protein WC916_05360 [Candidatus Woesearchaeota archaeon]
MKEIQLVTGKHQCGKMMDMRIVDVKDDDKNILAWMIYGICKKCNIVLISGLFEGNEEPKQNIDFMIDYEKKESSIRHKPL